MAVGIDTLHRLAGNQRHPLVCVPARPQPVKASEALMKVSVIGFAVGGAFLNLAFWDMPYYLMIILVVTEKWAKGILGEQKAAAPGDAPGLKSGGPLAAS